MHVFTGFLPDNVIHDLRNRYWEPMDLQKNSGWYMRGITINGDPLYLPHAVLSGVTLVKVEIRLIRAVDGKHLCFECFLQFDKKRFEAIKVTEIRLANKRISTAANKGDKKHELTIKFIEEVNT